MKQILIPTDFSENASDALEYALNLLGKSKARIHILHVVPLESVPSDASVVPPSLSSVNLKEAQESMKAIEEFSKMFYGEDDRAQITVSTKVTVGGVSYTIKKIAEDLGADLIIMGTRGVNHSFREKVFGTISTATISHAPCPVILVPSNYKFRTIDNLIFGTNLSPSDPYELWRALELIKPQIGRIRCVYVTKDKDKVDRNELDLFSRYVVEHSASIQTIFNVEESDDIVRTLAEYADNYDAEMIIMHRSKKSFWKSLFQARQTDKMVAWLDVPLMIIENKN